MVRRFDIDLIPDYVLVMATPCVREYAASRKFVATAMPPTLNRCYSVACETVFSRSWRTVLDIDGSAYALDWVGVV